MDASKAYRGEIFLFQIKIEKSYWKYTELVTSIMPGIDRFY